jgi:hypothetical protein
LFCTYPGFLGQRYRRSVSITPPSIRSQSLWGRRLWHYFRPMKKPPNKNLVLAMPCPTCGAGSGEKCKVSIGQLRTKAHGDRRVTALDRLRRKLDERTADIISTPDLLARLQHEIQEDNLAGRRGGCDTARAPPAHFIHSPRSNCGLPPATIIHNSPLPC